jgi:conjugal transfer pilus assembly protein TraA
LITVPRLNPLAFAARALRPVSPWLSAIVLTLLLSLLSSAAQAGTTGTEFQSMYTTLLNWATGYLGKAIAVAAFILGAGIGVARSSPVPALVGVVFALFMVYVPNIIDSIMTATV